MGPFGTTRFDAETREWEMQDPRWHKGSFCQNSDGAHGLCVSKTTLEAGNSPASECYFSHHVRFASSLGTESFISRFRVDSWPFNNRVSRLRGSHYFSEVRFLHLQNWFSEFLISEEEGREGGEEDGRAGERERERTTMLFFTVNIWFHEKQNKRHSFQINALS